MHDTVQLLFDSLGFGVSELNQFRLQMLYVRLFQTSALYLHPPKWKMLHFTFAHYKRDYAIYAFSTLTITMALQGKVLLFTYH